MSLSDDIIHGRYEQVARQMSDGVDVDYIDEFGFTPLIETCIVNRPDLAALLLKRGAQIDAIDISGQTALHWAIDNNNVEMTELLLKYKASPNSYSAHFQPVLFLPLLREHKDLQKILIDQGADINFAKDYINAKLIGHRFELQGHAHILSSDGLFLPLDLEGFFLEFTIGIIRDSLERFIKSFAAHRYDFPMDEISRIITTMRNASHLRQFKHYNVKVEENLETIKELISDDLLLLPVSYAGHAITFVKHGHLFAKCDRGVHKMTDPIVIHKMTHDERLNLDFYTHLMFEQQTEHSMKVGIYEALGLKPLIKLPIKHQITGNCSWANVEASVPTMLFMLLFDKIKTKNKAEVLSLLKRVMHFYTVWKDWDKDRAIEDCLYGFEQSTPNRKKAKASLLGAVLFQACDPKQPNDVIRAKKILEILVRPEYHFVMRSYINVFMKSGKGGDHGRKFHQMLVACGVSASLFEY